MSERQRCKAREELSVRPLFSAFNKGVDHELAYQGSDKALSDMAWSARLPMDSSAQLIKALWTGYLAVAETMTEIAALISMGCANFSSTPRRSPPASLSFREKVLAAARSAGRLPIILSQFLYSFGTAHFSARYSERQTAGEIGNEQYESTGTGKENRRGPALFSSYSFHGTV